MIDILYKVHEVISQDRIIREHVNINNIKFNKYPNVKDTDVPFIVIDDIDDPIPTTYTDGDECAYSYIVQIDVFVKYNDEYNARIIRNKISNRIQKLLWSELKMGNVSNGKPVQLEDHFMKVSIFHLYIKKLERLWVVDLQECRLCLVVMVTM
ncbi:putative bacteriophage protein [Staphylococcus aureus]|nr:putative bacteriophage protein [Staphylococcus aureus]